MTPLATRRVTLLALLAALVGAAALLLAVPGSAPQASFAAASDAATETMRTIDRAGLTVTRLSDEEEAQLGAKIDGMSRRPAGSEADRAYLQKLVESLAGTGALRRPELSWHAGIVESSEVNAYAVPGGYVYVTTAMLAFAKNEAELAGVLGHEMAHVDLRHCVERLQYRVAAEKIGGATLEVLAAIGSSLWQAGYADDQESDADRAGVLYAARAGYAPRAMLELFARMQMLHGGVTPKPGSIPGEVGQAVAGALTGYFRSHPTDAERVARVERAIGEQGLEDGETAWYVGAQNLAQRVPHSEIEFEDEWLAPSASSEPSSRY